MVTFSQHIQKEGFRSFTKKVGLAAGLALAAPTLMKADSDSLFKLISRHEGIRNHIYKDVHGNPTIGIGFNLSDENNRRILLKLNITEMDLRNGLTDKQVKELFDISLKQATNDANKFLPNLNSYPLNVQKAIIDMSFNLGYPRLSKFINLKKALQQRDFNQAAAEMLNSSWARQTGNRANELARMVKTAS